MPISPATPPATPPATIVLVHGAWADGSSWTRVIARLQQKNLPVIAVQLPLTSIEDDAAAAARIIADVDGRIVLVGHSWGGIAITQTGNDPKISALVYVSAFAPDIGETGSALIGAHPTPPALTTIVKDGSGFVYQTEVGMVENLAPDLPAAEARVLAATQGRLAGAAFEQTVTECAWKAKPSFYVVTAEDRVVSPDLQNFFAARMNAGVTMLHASHMSLLSQPDGIVAVIEDALAN
jgi:pimeloyl-ACP methyl ester carboxylesterase